MRRLPMLITSVGVGFRQNLWECSLGTFKGYRMALKIRNGGY